MAKCKTCGAPVDYIEGQTPRFDSSQYHMDAARKLSEISAWKGHAERLEVALRYWLPDETMVTDTHKEAWNEHVELLTD